MWMMFFFSPGHTHGVEEETNFHDQTIVSCDVFLKRLVKLTV